MITIDRGNGIEMYDETLLTPNHSVFENEHERTEITEYLLDGKVVHRGVHVHLKHGIGVEAVLGSFA